MEETKQIPIVSNVEPKKAEYANHCYVLPIDSEIVIDFNAINYHETLKHIKDGQPEEIHVTPIATIQMNKEIAMNLLKDLASHLMPPMAQQTQPEAKQEEAGK